MTTFNRMTVYQCCFCGMQFVQRPLIHRNPELLPDTVPCSHCGHDNEHQVLHTIPPGCMFTYREQQEKTEGNWDVSSYHIEGNECFNGHYWESAVKRVVSNTGSRDVLLGHQRSPRCDDQPDVDITGDDINVPDGCMFTFDERPEP
jgi:DNA-directed RNA polymerase subunit RPC12/RpoP